MAPLGRSRIDIKTLPARGRSLPSVPYDVMAIIGPANWGPMNVATLVMSYADAYEKFGTLVSTYEMLLQLKLFFENGGRRAVVTRICHITDHAASATPTTATKATYMLKTDAGGTYSDVNTLKVDALYYGVLTLKVKVQVASNAEAARFDLIVYRNDEQVEWFRNLSMLDTDANYAEDVINTASGRSKYIVVTDQALGGVGGLGADERPKTLTLAVTLTGGNDGMAAITDTDYTGATSFHTGLFAFSLIADGDLLIVPDRATTTFQNTAISYCETTKMGKMLFIPDTPVSSDAAAVIVHAQALAPASESSTGVLWPRIYISNPLKSTYGVAPQIKVCPSGLYCARIARNSEQIETKYFTQPGNEVYGLLDSAVDIETDSVLEPTVRDKVVDYKINCIVKGTRGIDGNFGVWVDDILLLKTSDNFVSVGEAHGISFLRKQFELYLERHRTQNNTPDRRRTIEDAFRAELLKWTQRHCFASDNAGEAFYVDADPDGNGLNNPLVQDEQQLKILVGVATARPARFIELIFTRDARAIESWIQQQLTAST